MNNWRCVGLEYETGKSAFNDNACLWAHSVSISVELAQQGYNSSACKLMNQRQSSVPDLLGNKRSGWGNIRHFADKIKHFQKDGCNLGFHQCTSHAQYHIRNVGQCAGQSTSFWLGTRVNWRSDKRNWTGCRHRERETRTAECITSHKRRRSLVSM